MSRRSPYIYLEDQLAGTHRYYADPVDIITAHAAQDVPRAFEAMQAALRKGHYLAGYAAYELGYALEPKLNGFPTQPGDEPLLKFGVFKSVDRDSTLDFDAATSPNIRLRPKWSQAEYLEKFGQVINYIQSGDVYQINLTFPLTGYYHGSAEALYGSLRRRQPSHYGGIVSLDEARLVSISPELFFARQGQTVTLRPMKGTLPRDPDPEQDVIKRRAMKSDQKSMAENLMIVDLLRNDLSRMATTGSVKVTDLFTLETYPTLHQMTSTIQGELRGGVNIQTLFESLFPCGSVTGAPKIRAMEIIHELEGGVRGAYCGGIGFIDPNGDACFNVAIRTLTLQGTDVTYRVGSGVVADSIGAEEYAECLLKAKVLNPEPPNLIETMRWKPGEGIERLERHLGRLSRSADALGYVINLDDIRGRLAAVSGSSDLRVRLLCSPDGNFTVETSDLTEALAPWKIAMSKSTLTPDVQETRYKVSDRAFYDGERERLQSWLGVDEVLFFNSADELCEGSFTNVFVDKDGELLTPKLSCGLLPGILREEMVETEQAKEAVLKLADLESADQLLVGNSLRGLIRATLIDTDRH